MVDLTDTERAVLELVKRGIDNKEISARLGIKPKTIKNIKWKLRRLGLLPEASSGEIEKKEGGGDQTSQGQKDASQPSANPGSTGPPGGHQQEQFPPTPPPSLKVVKEAAEEPPAPKVDVREILGDYTPVIKKVILNPKILMFYDYVRTQGYQGDLGDFLVDIVESYFRDRGLRIVVLRGVAEVS